MSVRLIAAGAGETAHVRIEARVNGRRAGQTLACRRVGDGWSIVQATLDP